MLYKITKKGLSHEEILRCIENIKKAFYDEDSYLGKGESLGNREYIDVLPEWPAKPKPDKCLEEIKAKLDEIVKKRVCKPGDGLYCVLSVCDGAVLAKYYFPFVDRYQRYFMDRKWQNPVRDPRVDADELLCLESIDKGNVYTNSSNNVKAYNHFINVVTAMARLISFFRDEKNIDKYIINGNKKQIDISYDKKHGFRIFTLMLAAFYHDIGKTVEYHRHGMEGAIILSDHRSKAWNDFIVIIDKYHGLYPDDFCYKFEHDDLIFISDFLYYHDQFGPLSTGESGYLRLVDLVSRVKKHSLICNKQPYDPSSKVQDDQKRWSYRFLFDLWLLNLADIIASYDNKDEIDTTWEYEDRADRKIEEFLTENDQASILLHDLNISFKLLDTINEHLHSDNLSEAYKEASDFSKRHTTERLRRLTYVSIERALRQFCKNNHYRIPSYKVSNEQKSKSIENVLRKFKEIKIVKGDLAGDLTSPYNTMRSILGCINEDLCLGVFDDTFAASQEGRLNTSTREVNAIINRHIKTMGDFDAFSERFSLVGQMDYALGCFQQIVETALDCVYVELIVPHKYKSKLIRDINAETIEGDMDFLIRLNSKLLVENLISVFIEIIHHLLFRDEFGTRLRNIEFNDLRKRLNDEKIRAILSQDGHARMKRALQLILQTVFLY
ncbi:MAG: hypothetical protein HQK97_05930 [Nitrospirae bacterium]|nr:hypothetical protein [Nitrospirota bacterium]